MQITKIEANPYESKIIRNVAYARVSSNSADQLHSFAAQLRYYHTMFQHSTDSVLVNVYADEGITGTDMQKRDEFNRMMNDARKHKFDRIICKTITRFARNTKDCLKCIRELKTLGISVYFEENKLDTMKVSGEVLITLLSMSAQNESLSISKNVRWGIQKRMEEGTFIDATAPYGYDYIDKKLVINPEQAEIVRRIFNDFLAGKGMKAIAEELTDETHEKWWYSRINRILQNEKYIGDSLYQKKYTTEQIPFRQRKNKGEMPQYMALNTHEGIIPKEIFEKAQALIKKRNEQVERKPAVQYPLSQKIICGKCGYKYRRTDIRGKIYWVCRNHKDNGNKCPAKQIPEYAIYDAFIRMFNKLKTNRSAVLNPVISQLEKLSIILKSGNEQAMKIQSEITQLREQSYQLSRLNTLGILTDSIYASKRTELDGKMENLRKELISVSTTDETDKQIEQLSFLSSIIDDEDIQTDFDPNLFGQIVTKITALDSDTIRFTLHGGIEFNEAIIREKR
ncbi:MAG: recombinase family protein [Ruminiclostridium sp.]